MACLRYSLGGLATDHAIREGSISVRTMSAPRQISILWHSSCLDASSPTTSYVVYVRVMPKKLQEDLTYETDPPLPHGKLLPKMTDNGGDGR